jgi:hypothetical protein
VENIRMKLDVCKDFSLVSGGKEILTPWLHRDDDVRSKIAAVLAGEYDDPLAELEARMQPYTDSRNDQISFFLHQKEKRLHHQKPGRVRGVNRSQKNRGQLQISGRYVLK